MGVVRPEAKLPGDPANADILYTEYTETLTALGAGGVTLPTLTIINGVLTLPSNSQGSAAGRYLVETQGGASTDDLDTISGGLDGEEIELWAVNAAHQVQHRHAVGNIRMQGGIAFTLNSLGDHVVLRRRGSTWYGKGFNIP